jgi:hypothetical protein
MSKTYLTISVDYEGRNLLPENLEAFRQLRRDYPQVPLVHFLNPTYFLLGDSIPETKTKLQSLQQAGDEIGMHIHGHRALIEAAKVEFNQDYYSYYGFTHKVANAPHGQQGSEAILDRSYTPAEILTIFMKGRQVLKEAGFPMGISFRAGGWMAGKYTLSALVQSGFRIDSSAVPVSWLQKAASDETKPQDYRFTCGLLLRAVGSFWNCEDGAITPKTQPFVISTEHGDILEMPDTGCLADYVSTEDMLTHIHEARLRAAVSGKDQYAHIGFHQETAAEYLGKIHGVLEAIHDHPDISIVTLKEAGRHIAKTIL